MDEQTKDQSSIAYLVSNFGPTARAEYAENCRMMIEINKAKVKETEEKIRLAERLNDQRELAHLRMELDGWVEWVKRWETGLAAATGDGN